MISLKYLWDNKQNLRGIAFLLFTILSVTSMAELAAFPGAEGFGAYAVGGRGGQVYHVTNLNDSGPGSFRDAVSQSGRIVVFDVSGVILIKSRISVKDHITIAGQTAPGDGVVVYGNGLSFSSADHTVVRFMRFRMGLSGDKGKDAITIAKGSPMVFDHCSVSWGRDETFSISGEDGLFTLQNCIIAQGLDTHSCGGLIQNWGGISILRCLYIDNHTRNPKVKGVNQFVNNVIYNWRTAGYILGGGSAGQSYANVMNNYYISGPETPDRSPFTRGNENFHLYAVDNYNDSNKNGLLDGTCLEKSDYSIVDWQQKPYPYPEITIYSPGLAYRYVVSQVGASMPKRDQVDEFLIGQLQSLGKYGKVISDEKQLPTGGPGKLRPGESPSDRDRDGMPDYWERSIEGLDSEKADHNGDVDENGYTNIEDYLNWLARPHAVVARNGQVEVDLKEYTSGFSSKAVYSIESEDQVTASLKEDGHTVRIKANRDYTGQAGFRFTVHEGEPLTMPFAVLVMASGAGG